MWLLSAKPNGELSLTEFVGEDERIPPYAILSHTWGLDSQEVKFQDIENGTGRDKEGYQKILFCQHRAAADGLEFFWVDTCCIDKRSSSKLSEAIISMFRWYKGASKCYAYLSDVSIDRRDWDETSSQNALRRAIAESRWFTRGWTLQELLAPSIVEFYSMEGQYVGDKAQLEATLHQRTGIPKDALRGERALSKFPVDERISWAANRITKRGEDLAYSLLGILQVQIAPLYGEGKESAHLRLQTAIEMSRMRPGASQSYQLTPVGYDHEEKGVKTILEDLRFPQMEDRQRGIHEAHGTTYEWILRPLTESASGWDSFIDWLSSSTEDTRSYWISGKPGSGKSTMMRFLDRAVDVSGHMSPWADGKTVLRASYFFWNPGSLLQKSITGLLRTLLAQLLMKEPSLTQQVVEPTRWTAAQNGSRSAHWTKDALKHSLFTYLRLVQHASVVFLLIDGLDEITSADDSQDELIDLLLDLSNLPHIKQCVSSRPLNIFRDTFQQVPHLSLEDLTHRDIEIYVRAKLDEHARFRHMSRNNMHGAERARKLTVSITRKAAGVFLWVRLVTRDLLKGLRDGDDIDKLENRVNVIPEDLFGYFQSMMNAITPQQRQEASAILQIALYEESDYVTVFSLDLMDLSFLTVPNGQRPDFLLAAQQKSEYLIPPGSEALAFRLDSTFRYLNSRCMGLLNCSYKADALVEEDCNRRIPQEHDSNLKVDFIHRSCRDFLLTSDCQHWLESYTQGPYDARLYLLNARIAQFMALVPTVSGSEMENDARALASSIISSLARPAFKDSPVCFEYANLIEPILRRFIQNIRYAPDALYYFNPIVHSWFLEQSSFLILAIDFDLNSYTKSYLTSEFVRSKRGRPVLDYILRPRFWQLESGSVKIRNQRPNLEVLYMVLALGADPNEFYESNYGSTSVWALYLCLVNYLCRHHAPVSKPHNTYKYAAAMAMMLRAGAATILPRSWINEVIEYEQFGFIPTESEAYVELAYRANLFTRLWPSLAQTHTHAPPWADPRLRMEPWYRVHDLLENFRPYMGSYVDMLQGLLGQLSHASTSSAMAVYNTY